MTDDGYVVWFTGSPARASPPSPGRCWPRLASRGQKVELLDGDEVRTTSARTSASAQEDRDTNIARIGYVAGKLSKHGVAVLVAAISPYREARDRVRASVPNFVEVHVATLVEVCAERDVKRRGLMPSLQASTAPASGQASYW
jgi:adenylylsulfate kinase